MPVCKKCGNTMRETYEKQYMGMGKYRQVKSGEFVCEYCIWKGDAGPGKALAELIKEVNNA